MSSSINRRDWLKKSVLATAGISAASAFIQRAEASPIARQELYMSLSPEFQLERDYAHFAPAVQIRARLGANENPWGPSEKTKKALTDSLSESNRYAFKVRGDLMKVIAEKEGVPESHILLAAGSSELLTASMIAYGAKGKIICADPCYISGNEERIPMEKVPLTKDFQYDLSAIAGRLNGSQSLVYITNPNNPTGAILPIAELNAFIDKVSDKTPVLVDEAYIDYTKSPKAECAIEAVKAGKNVLILRTMSKLYAFAGLRVGYAIAKPEILKVIQPYTSGGFSVSVPSFVAAATAIKDVDFQKLTLEKTAESKQYLYDFLKKMDYSYIPSATNFVLFPIKMKGADLLAKLSAEGVMVRKWEFDHQHWCRVSIGTLDEMKIFTEAFTKVVS
ncbi:histidinol-phosphate aminotransferase [Pseudarcicella hirudinis]|uniref:Histidinol-phosphate aminotransferase n=2 Tax=Pseudarcicella hirudinis TaxID=1079859 RepID=A0A1I5U8M1_9BACT|nr:aminotransferase class I/II-fold pyridoxal phosphate-dependent enzyme [Pseudarcicella hirudinis]SFP91605.1 histidinol-phosphate aminotransferase [Pseudarcicella hirudinis]